MQVILCLSQSSRTYAQTGLAVVWKISPLFADWIGSAQNFLFQQKILDCSSTVLELGCGISGIVALALGPLVGRYIATDQDYALKLLKQNIAENSPKPSEPHRRTLSRDPKIREKATDTHLSAAVEKVKIMALDWELDSLDTLPEILRAGVRHVDICLSQGVDAVIACDCIYNEALIEPFVRTCVDICRLRQAESEARLTMCIIAQQLRSSEIFETWLIAFHKAFHVWRISDHLLTGSLKQDSGFIVHIGTLRI